MGECIAAIDESASARPVLVAAIECARLFGDEVVALTVREDGRGPITVDTAAALGVPLRVRRGKAVPEIVDTAEAAEVTAVVVGSRGLPSTRRPVGSTALALIQTLAKPVVVVPPTTRIEPARVRRVLVPLDGTGETAAAVQEQLRRLRPGTQLDVVALHVFDADDIPAFSDQPGHETAAWGEEFLRRWLPIDNVNVRLETRVGRPADVVGAVAREINADAVAVGWKQDLSLGRAQVVTALLAESRVLAVLLPVAS